MKGSRIGVMPMMQFRESQKTGLEYDEIELAVFDLCFYIILCSVSLNILDKCDDPTLSKPLVSALQISGHHVNLEFLALNSLFPKTVTKCVQEGLSREWSQTTNISNQQKKQKQLTIV